MTILDTLPAFNIKKKGTLVDLPFATADPAFTDYMNTKDVNLNKITTTFDPLYVTGERVTDDQGVSFEFPMLS